MWRGVELRAGRNDPNVTYEQIPRHRAWSDVLGALKESEAGFWRVHSCAPTYTTALLLGSTQILLKAMPKGP